MSPWASKRQALLEGALRCLEERGYGATTARDIAEASGANLASIGYHFGSKDGLLGEALILGLQRWFAEFAKVALPREPSDLRAGLHASIAALRDSVASHRGLALAYIEVLARAPRDRELRALLAESYAGNRATLAALLNLGDDAAARALAGIGLAAFDGLLFQWLVDPEHGPSEDDLRGAIDRLRELMAAGSEADL